MRRWCHVTLSARLEVADLDHAAGAEHGVEHWARGEGGEDAKGEALGGGIRVLALQHVQHGLNQTALYSLAVVAVVGHHVAEKAQHGGGRGGGRQHGAQGGQEGANDRVVAAQVRQRLQALQGGICKGCMLEAGCEGRNIGRRNGFRGTTAREA